MQLSQQQFGDELLVKAQGRLDASWSEFFADAMLDHVRQGHHHLVLDAGDMVFLSSAGIRALLRIHKEVLSVQGSFRIVHATDFVKNTLTTIGLDTWLSDESVAEAQAILPEEADNPRQEEPQPEKDYLVNFYPHSEGAALSLTHPATWQPWQKVHHHSIAKLRFTPDTFSLGIGSTTEHEGVDAENFGEFMAVCGHVIYQAPDEKLRPDYLLSESNYAPELHTIQASLLKGEMARLMRFSPIESRTAYTTSELIALMCGQAATQEIGFVILAECGGLVGATLIQSPGKLSNDTQIDYPEIRNWLSFCGERAFAGQLALMVGMPAKPVLAGLHQETAGAYHIHAAVFPYQPIQNGLIAMADSVTKVLTGPPPIGLMHLINDARPVNGLGESSLIRGACWFSPIQRKEENI